MYTSQQATDFNQRVGLGNSYCNCFHLMCRVEKSTWYIFKKERCSRDTPRKVLGTTNSLALRGFNTVDRVFFSCVRRSISRNFNSAIPRMLAKNAIRDPNSCYLTQSRCYLTFFAIWEKKCDLRFYLTTIKKEQLWRHIPL